MDFIVNMCWDHPICANLSDRINPSPKWCQEVAKNHHCGCCALFRSTGRGDIHAGMDWEYFWEGWCWIEHNNEGDIKRVFPVSLNQRVRFLVWLICFDLFFLLHTTPTLHSNHPKNFVTCQLPQVSANFPNVIWRKIRGRSIPSPYFFETGPILILKAGMMEILESIMADPTGLGSMINHSRYSRVSGWVRDRN